MATVEQFFEDNPPPQVLSDYKDKISQFVAAQVEQGQRVALVTSGGTTVPLERNTVRYLDNFSEGRRGSSSAEEFLAAGYSVIFLHRKYSLQPFTRRFMTKARNFLDHLYLSEDEHISVVPKLEKKVKEAFRQYQRAKDNNRLLVIPYVSVTDYLFMIREIGISMQPLGKKGLIYLAAAVSDFYIPYSRLSEHKIQSKENQNGLQLQLDPVPKMLGTLTGEWAPQAFTVSFKLETKDELLEPKALGSLNTYGQQIVIGNLLKNHQDQVILYKQNGSHQKICRTEEEREAFIDIESRLIPSITSVHGDFSVGD